MKNNTVVIVYCSEDGDHSVFQMDKAKFLQQLKVDYKDSRYGPTFFDPDNHDRTDLNRFAGMIVIEGQIVRPKALKVETEWEI